MENNGKKKQTINDSILENWDKKYKEDLREELNFFETGNFSTAQEAIKFALKQSVVKEYCKLDDSINDDQLSIIANLTLDTLRNILEKNKKIF